MSQKDLAERLGVVPRTVYSWEAGENGGAFDHIGELEMVLGPLGGLPVEEEPSIAAALAELRKAATSLDIAREMLHALTPN